MIGSHPWIQVARPELYIVTPPVTFAIDDLTSYFDALEREEVLARPNAWVVDISFVQARSVDATKRKLLAEHERSLTNKRDHCAGAAIVAKHRVQRGLLTAIFWMSPPVYPWATFVERGDAITWAGNALSQMSRAST